MGIASFELNLITGDSIKFYVITGNYREFSLVTGDSMDFMILSQGNQLKFYVM
jgi:hypothetical protein